LFGWHREFETAFGERYLSKSAFSDTSEENEVEKVDIGIKVDDLRKRGA
jgi:hypothetical protein